MIQKIFAIFILCILASWLIHFPVSAAEHIASHENLFDMEDNESVSENTTVWSLSGSPYLVASDTTIPAGETLTIEPGVTVQFAENARLNVQGTLDAQGTLSSPITFTSQADNPAAGDWYGIVFKSDSNSTLGHAVIEYAQYGVYIDGDGTQALTDCTIRYNTEGVRVEASGGNPVIHRSDFYDNTAYNYRLTYYTSTNLTLDATNNWWGTADPAAIADTIYDYFDSSNRAVVDYTGFLDGPGGNPVPGNYLIGATSGDRTLTEADYIVPGSYWVRPDHTLTIPTGTTLLFGADRWLRVSGSLIAEGIEADEVIFTSLAAEPAAGDWYGIVFKSDSNGTLNHTTIEYAKYGVHIDGNGTQELTDCTIRYNTEGVRVKASGGNPVIHWSDFYDNVAYNYRLTDDTSANLTLDATNNWWGTQNELEIAEKIWDSQDDANLGTVNFDPWIPIPPDDVDGPVISNIRFNGIALQSGDTLTPSGTLTLHAVDILSGMQRVEFYVDGELQHIDYNNTGDYRFDWDLAAIDDGSYDITIKAFDNHPDANMTEVVLENMQVIPELHLPSGWSMVSLHIDATDKRLEAVFPNAMVVYGYEKGTGYVQVKPDEELTVGKGYWILLDQATSYTIPGQPIDSHILPANEDGWAMIGGCTHPAQVLPHSCEIGVIYGYTQGIGYQRVRESERLEPGKGYWILLNNVDAEATISVETVD